MGLQRRASGELLMTASGALADECCCAPIPPSDDCDWSVSPESLVFDCGAQAGAFNVNVLTGSGCGWSASVTSGGAYLTINSGSSGSSSGTVGFDLLSNSGVDRTAQITVVTTVVSPLGPPGSVIGVFDLTQSECSGMPLAPPGAPPPPGDVFRWSISPGAATFDCPSQNGFFNVNTQLGAGWAASVISGGSFITIFSGSTGSDAGTVQFNVAANSGAERGGQIEVITTVVSTLGAAGTVIGYFNIAQMAASACGSGGSGLAPCNWEVMGKSWTVNDPCAISEGRAKVITNIGCSWNAVVLSGAFITITSGSTGLSSGTIVFDVAANATTSRRHGIIRVTTGTPSVFGPIGSLIQDIQIEEDACAICDTTQMALCYQVDPTQFNGASCPVCFNSPGVPWTGQINRCLGNPAPPVSPCCSMVFTAASSGNRLSDGTEVFSDTGGPIVISFGGGVWRFTLSCNPLVFGSIIWSGTKSTGATPEGVYIQDDGCQVLPTVTVSAC